MKPSLLAVAFAVAASAAACANAQVLGGTTDLSALEIPVVSAPPTDATSRPQSLQSDLQIQSPVVTPPATAPVGNPPNVLAYYYQLYQEHPDLKADWNDGRSNFDQDYQAAQIPEPAGTSLGLAALALGGAAFVRWSRRQKECRTSAQ